MGNKRGFTLIELIMVIAILAILATVSIPKFIDLTIEAKKSGAQGGLGSIRSAVAISYAQSITTGTATYPSSVTTSLFADSQIPGNPLSSDSTTVGNVTVAPSGTATSSNGWWYITASGRVGAYSDGTVNTSAF